MWCDSLEQHSRKSCIRLNGIPEEQGEVTSEVVLKVASDIKVDIKPEDIEIAHRLGPSTDKDGRPIHRQIIARLRNHDVRRNMLKNSKALKGASIRQDLTLMRNGIAYEARQLFNKGKIEGTWITDGKIFVSTPNRRSIFVKSYEHLAAIANIEMSSFSSLKKDKKS